MEIKSQPNIDANISCESNLFQLTDVDQMCSETLSLVKDVGDLLCFQNENNEMAPRKSINNLSFSDSDSEDSQKKSSSDEESDSDKENEEEDEELHFQKENGDEDCVAAQSSDNESSDEDDITNDHGSGKWTKKTQSEASSKKHTSESVDGISDDLQSTRNDGFVENLQNATVATV